MSTKSYEKMTKPELEEASKFFKLNDRVQELATDNERQDGLPTKADYIQALNEFKDKQAASVETDETEDEIGGETGSSNKSKEQLVVDDLTRKVMVIVHDHNNTQTTEEDLEGMVYTQGWGNMLTGGYSDNIALHGRPQYVHRGAILAMEDILIPTTFKDNEGKEKPSRTKKRFAITEVDGWTQDQLDSHAKEQKLKKI